MKKIIFIITLIFTFFIGFNVVNAASVSLAASTKNVVVGNTFTVNVTVSNDAAAWDFSIGYDTSKLRVVSSGLESGMHSASASSLHGRNYSLTFKALESGSASVYVSDATLYDDSETPLSSSKGSVSVNISTQEQIEASYSKNNNLASLSIDGVEISPAFNKDTTSYTAEVAPDTTSIKVNATVADSKASVKGTGEVEVTEGDNNVEIIVTAENGTTKTYTIKVTVKEYDPIKVKINGKEYTVVRKKSMLKELNGYKETTVKIKDNDIPALKSDITGYTLVALKDSKGNQDYYIKDKDTYTLYKEYTFGRVILYPLKWNKKDIPKNYKKTKITYNDDKIDAYKIKKSSKYALIYGMNVETGEKHIYQYDSQEDTVQIYNEEEIKIIKKENAMYLKIVLGLGILSSVLAIVTIAMYVKNNKRKKIKIKKVK